MIVSLPDEAVSVPVSLVVELSANTAGVSSSVAAKPAARTVAEAIASQSNALESIPELPIDLKPPCTTPLLFLLDFLAALLNQRADLGVVGFDKIAEEHLEDRRSGAGR
jgi:hypothetical protein